MILLFNDLQDIIYFDLARETMPFLNACPMLDIHGLSSSFINGNFKSFSHFIINAINDDYYIYLYISTSCISHYHSRGGEHDVMIFGYDANKKQINIADFFMGKYSFKVCSFEEMENAYNTARSNTRGIVLIKKKNVYQSEINVPVLKDLLRDYLIGERTVKLIDWDLHMITHNSDYGYGINIYDAFMERICIYGTSFGFVPRSSHVIYDHKTIMHKLVSVLEHNGYLRNSEYVIEKIREAKQQALILRNLILKLNVSGDNRITPVIDRIKNLRMIEKDAIEALVNNLSENELPIAFIDGTGNSQKENDNHFSSVWVNRENGGDWVGQYGELGYYVVGMPPNYPVSVKMRIHGASFALGSVLEQNDERALLIPNNEVEQKERIVAILHSYCCFNIEFFIPELMIVTFYAYDNLNQREMLVELIDARTQHIVVTFILKRFSSGVYFSFLLSGHFRLALRSWTSKDDALIMGIFFDKNPSVTQYQEDDA